MRRSVSGSNGEGIQIADSSGGSGGKPAGRSRKPGGNAAGVVAGAGGAGRRLRCRRRSRDGHGPAAALAARRVEEAEDAPGGSRPAEEVPSRAAGVLVVLAAPPSTTKNRRAADAGQSRSVATARGAPTCSTDNPVPAGQSSRSPTPDPLSDARCAPARRAPRRDSVPSDRRRPPSTRRPRGAIARQRCSPWRGRSRFESGAGAAATTAAPSHIESTNGISFRIFIRSNPRGADDPHLHHQVALGNQPLHALERFAIRVIAQ